MMIRFYIFSLMYRYIFIQNITKKHNLNVSCLVFYSRCNNCLASLHALMLINVIRWKNVSNKHNTDKLITIYVYFWIKSNKLCLIISCNILYTRTCTSSYILFVNYLTLCIVLPAQIFIYFDLFLFLLHELELKHFLMNFNTFRFFYKFYCKWETGDRWLE